LSNRSTLLESRAIFL